MAQEVAVDMDRKEVVVEQVYTEGQVEFRVAKEASPGLAVATASPGHPHP